MKGSKTNASNPMRMWIAERTMRATQTILIEARSRKEAQAKLDKPEGGIGVNIEYTHIQRAKVIREDKVRLK